MTGGGCNASNRRRNVTSRYYGSKISGSQQSFLTRRPFSLSKEGRKKWATDLFLSAIMHRKVIHVNFFRFFLPYLQDNGLL